MDVVVVDELAADTPKQRLGCYPGTRQRIGLQAALVCPDPCLVVLDEPWEGLILMPAAGYRTSCYSSAPAFDHRRCRHIGSMISRRCATAASSSSAAVWPALW